MTCPEYDRVARLTKFQRVTNDFLREYFVLYKYMVVSMDSTWYLPVPHVELKIDCLKIDCPVLCAPKLSTTSHSILT